MGGASEQRLVEYWLHGPGAAKIAWGTPHDFDRCVVLTAAAGVPAHMVKGFCSNLHVKALGVRPGQE
jgi:hypothetical protein